MKVITVDTAPHLLEADALILGFADPTNGPEPWPDLDRECGGLLSEALAGPAFRPSAGHCIAVPLRGAATCAELILVGLGKTPDLETWRRAIASAARMARARGNRRVAVAVRDSDVGDAAALGTAAAEAVILGCYRFTEFKAPEATDGAIDELILATSADINAAVLEAQCVAEAACWARDLVNKSPSDKRPPQLSAMAEQMAGEAGLRCQVIDGKDAAELGLNALLAVARGSTSGPRLVILEHSPAGHENEPPVVLVGKGITFDTGGISIKPSAGMDEMKSDMAGCAAVLGTMRAVAGVELPRRVIGITPMAENMPDGDAYRPGDLIRAHGGKTIEVLNTDAEGRLVLADALSYAKERFSPRCMVDLATLTGACVVALGDDVAGVMSNGDSPAEALLAAGERTGETLWPMPMFPAYRKLIESSFADIKNTGGRGAGAITAAKFLEEFVGDTPWSHIDIAGPSYTKKTAGYRVRGGTGFGVRLLVDWLRQASTD